MKTFIILIVMLTVSASNENRNITNVDNYDVNIRSMDENTYELIAIFSTRVYKKIIDQDYIQQSSPIIKSCPNLLRQALERHIYSKNDHSSFFEMKYTQDKITLKFVIDMDYIKETIVLKLHEFTQKSFEQKIDERIDILVDDLADKVENMQPNKYILKGIEYIDSEDEFIHSFNWDVAHQEERKKYIKLIDDKYIIMGDVIIKREPLTLTIDKGVAHLYGWMEFNKPIEIPEDIETNSKIARMIQTFDTTLNGINSGVLLVLDNNKLQLYYKYKDDIKLLDPSGNNKPFFFKPSVNTPRDKYKQIKPHGKQYIPVPPTIWTRLNKQLWSQSMTCQME